MRRKRRYSPGSPPPRWPFRPGRRRALTLSAIIAALCLPRAGWSQAQRGDVNRDLQVDVTDAINVLGYLFLGNFTPYCQPVINANGDGRFDISDPVAILGFLFRGDPPLSELSAEELAKCPWNEPPLVPSRPVYRAYPGHAVELNLGATDPEHEPLRYEPLDLPAGADLEEDGLLRWTPGPDQLGPSQMRFLVLDGALPPNRVVGTVVFQILPLDGCTRPRCDPALGCELEIVALPEECCGEPAARVAEPEIGCPEGRVLHVGRNPRFAPTIGRLQNCDSLRLVPLGQGGHVVRLSFEARCFEPEQVVLRARLETQTTLYFDETLERNFETREDGYVQALTLGFIAEGPVREDVEAQLTITATSLSGVVLERKVRVVITLAFLEDLP